MATPEWDEMWELLDSFSNEHLKAVQKITKYIYGRSGSSDNMTGMPEAMEAERQIRAINIAVREKLGY